jgi:hypothetical protein
MAMKIPTTLKHKPVIVVEDYDRIDGRSAYASEAKGLSLGLAQWNDRGRVDISAKVWRFTGEKWSRQSEELPPHRVLDLAILIAAAKLHYAAQRKTGEDGAMANLPMQGDAMRLSLCQDNDQIQSDERLLRDALGRDDELISERLNTLRRLLEEMP